MPDEGTPFTGRRTMSDLVGPNAPAAIEYRFAERIGPTTAGTVLALCGDVRANSHVACPRAPAARSAFSISSARATVSNRRPLAS